MNHILEVKKLSVSFDGLAVVRGVDLKIKKGEVHGLLGESGSGKTVTTYALSKLHDHASYEGQVLYKGESVLDMKELKLTTLRGYDIAYIFQNPHESFNPNMRIQKQLMEAMSIHGLQPNIDKILEVMTSVGLKNPAMLIKKYPDQLSGGECQRLMIGMSLLCEPEIIIADEPTSAIDASIKMQIINLLKHINEVYKTTIIIISHDMDLVKHICDSMSVMYGGLILEQGLTSQVLDTPKHPYTQALIDCTQSLNETVTPLVTLPGLPLSPDLYNEGCAFYERCNHKMERCQSEMPEMVTFNSHQYRCHLEV